MQNITRAALLLALAAPLAAQDDGFARERRGETAAAKDALEGKAPPALAVTDWMNTRGFTLESLRGKVVVLDFWGTW